MVADQNVLIVAKTNVPIAAKRDVIVIVVILRNQVLAKIAVVDVLTDVPIHPRLPVVRDAGTVAVKLVPKIATQRVGRGVGYLAKILARHLVGEDVIPLV